MNNWRRCILGILLSISVSSVLFAADGPGSSHEGHFPSWSETSVCVSAPGFESIQIETSDLAAYEQLFSILKAPLVEQHNHPGRDRLKGYCYRGVSIVVRQDVQAPRPTGWVQVNFAVHDVAAIQEELDQSYKESAVANLEEMERNKIIRFRLKPDVKRGDRQAVRLEVLGPEGFMIGFNQYK